MPASGTEAVQLSQLKTYADSVTEALDAKQDTLTLPLAVASGGTGLTAAPSMLTNLASTSAAGIFAASPRPGVTGTLPIANGGTGATSASAALTALGAASADDLDGKLDSPGTTGSAGQLLQSDGDGTYSWVTPSEGTTYTGTSPIVVSGSTISVNSAGEGTSGVVSFATDADFSTYMEID